MTGKKCATCHEVKPLDEFRTRGKTRPGGCQSNCKSCHTVYAREWARRHPEGNRARNAQWQRENRERKNENTRRRTARLRGCQTTVVTPRDWARLLARYGHRCAYCGSDGLLTQDHVIPISKGGQHSIGNLLPACKSCNSSKRDKLLVEWRRIGI